jgi:hypothetical protein
LHENKNIHFSTRVSFIHTFAMNKALFVDIVSESTALLKDVSRIISDFVSYYYWVEPYVCKRRPDQKMVSGTASSLSCCNHWIYPNCSVADVYSKGLSVQILVETKKDFAVGIMTKGNRNFCLVRPPIDQDIKLRIRDRGSQSALIQIVRDPWKNDKNLSFDFSQYKYHRGSWTNDTNIQFLVEFSVTQVTPNPEKPEVNVKITLLNTNYSRSIGFPTSLLQTPLENQCFLIILGDGAAAHLLL